MENNDKCISMDYEVECKRLREIIRGLKEEIACMKNYIREAEKENATMKGKLEMVYLIFGGINRG